MISALYLTRNGLLEPLGQSQVFSYLRGLSNSYSITLITYEKDEDWADSRRVQKAFDECRTLGIRWLPQHFRFTPKLVAPALSMVRMLWIVTGEVRAQDVRLIHARSYIPAAVALVAGWLTSVPFVFDMRALWPEELITAGRLQRGSWLHRLIVYSERLCLRKASAVVSLTNAAVSYLKEQYPQNVNGKPLVVIPTCADLDRFVPSDRPPERRVIGCLGTVLSGWFKIDWLASFLSVAARRDPELWFELTTRDDAEQVRAAIGGDSAFQAKLEISPSPSEKVHEVVQGQTASVMFYMGGAVSELGRSPTRMAEILGCGLPIVANEGVGDVAKIIRQYRVGVIVTGPSHQEMEAAWDELQELLLDSDLASRCRQAAEEIFSLDSGVAAYSALYEEVLKNNGAMGRKR